MNRYQVRILKNLGTYDIQKMLNNGWTLNSIVVLPYSNYHGVISRETIEKEFYFIKQELNTEHFFEVNDSSDINREL